MRILGLDLSLTCTGVCVWDNGAIVETRTITPKLCKKPNWRDKADRVFEIAYAIDSMVMMYGIDVVAIEDYAYTQTNRAHQIGELHGVVMHLLSEIPLIDVERINTLAAAKSLGVVYERKQKKQAVRLAVNALYGQQIECLDISDAVAVAHCAAVNLNQHVPKFDHRMELIVSGDDEYLSPLAPKAKRKRKAKSNGRERRTEQ